MSNTKYCLKLASPNGDCDERLNCTSRCNLVHILEIFLPTVILLLGIKKYHMKRNWHG